MPNGLVEESSGDLSMEWTEHDPMQDIGPDLFDWLVHEEIVSSTSC